METFLMLFLLPPLKAFKSYYVVWKPQHIPFFVISGILFKSYYVVWKLERRVRYETRIFV